MKDEGNIAFKSGRLEEAVAKYTEALEVSEAFSLLVMSDFDGVILVSSSELERVRKRVKADKYVLQSYPTVPPHY